MSNMVLFNHLNKIMRVVTTEAILSFPGLFYMSAIDPSDADKNQEFFPNRLLFSVIHLFSLALFVLILVKIWHARTIDLLSGIENLSEFSGFPGKLNSMWNSIFKLICCDFEIFVSNWSWYLSSRIRKCQENEHLIKKLKVQENHFS